MQAHPANCLRPLAAQFAGCLSSVVDPPLPSKALLIEPV